MDCRTTSVHKFRTRLRFKQHFNKTFLGYRIDLYSHDYKLAVEIAKNGHSDININYEIKRQKSIE